MLSFEKFCSDVRFFFVLLVVLIVGWLVLCSVVLIVVGDVCRVVG